MFSRLFVMTMLTGSAAALVSVDARAEESAVSDESDSGAAHEGFDQPMTLSLEADFGLAGRLRGSDAGYRDEERAGALVGGGIFFSPMPIFDLGLTYQRTQLGTEIAPPGEVLAANTVFRSLNSVWANVRTYPYRGEKVGLFVGLLFGPSWESSRGHVTYPPSGVAGTMRSYSCSASGPAALALGVTAGVDVDLGSGLAFLTRLTGSSYHVSSDLLEDSEGRICGPGAGGTATLDARIGFAYRFDLGAKVSSSAVTASN